jgi:uncharacterized small protein (DUF1192 family)
MTIKTMLVSVNYSERRARTLTRQVAKAKAQLKAEKENREAAIAEIGR